MAADGRTRAHLLMVPFPAQPHTLPMLDLAHRIARRARGGIAITFVTYETQIDRLRGESEEEAIRFVGVRDADPEQGFPSDFGAPLRDSFRLGCSLDPLVEQLHQRREDRPTCMLADYLNWWSLDIATKLSIARYILCVMSTTRLAMQLSWHEHGLAELPGGGIRLADIPANLVYERWEFPLCDDRKRTFPKWIRSMKESDGVLLNGWTALESQTIDCIRMMLPQEMPLLAVGPLGAIPSSQSKNVSMEDFVLSDDDEVTTWLDQQPPSSVLYVAFGTTGLLRLSKRHVLELAEGLQRSQQRFVWALRAPPDVQDIDDALPPGFKESTSGRGLLLILSHPSTGGFLSSCGWNSAVESLSRGVPIVGWPSFADQPTVCRVLALSKLGIELPHKEDFFVTAEVIADAITVILVSEEGTAMRQRAAQCKVSIAAALAPGGTSFRSVEDFCELIERGPT